MYQLHSTGFYITLLLFYFTLPDSTLHYHGSTSLYLNLRYFSKALLHCTWLYITLPWFYFTLRFSILWLCFTLLDSTLVYYCTTSLYLTLHHSTIAPLHSTWIYITRPWLNFTLLYSTLLYCGFTSLYLTLHYSTMAYFTLLRYTLLYQSFTSLYLTPH